MKSINEHLASLGKSLDSDSVKQSAQRARADVAKATAKTPDTETAQLVKSWAYSQLSQTTPKEHFARLGVAALTAGLKVRYSIEGAEHYGLISKASDNNQTASITRYQLADHDYGAAKASDQTDHIPYRNVCEVFESFPSATQRTTAFNAWVMAMKGQA